MRKGLVNAGCKCPVPVVQVEFILPGEIIAHKYIGPPIVIHITDGDTITVSAVTQATNGSVTFTGSDATYTPNADFNGSDSFTYTITDTLLTATATVCRAITFFGVVPSACAMSLSKDCLI